MPLSKSSLSTVIKVIGIGNVGHDAISYMVNTKFSGIELIAANTDAHALSSINAHTLLQLSTNLIENHDNIRELLSGTEMLFIITKISDGTDTGVALTIAEIAKEMSILTFAILSKPFTLEDKESEAYVSSDLKLLSDHVNSLIIIPSEHLTTSTQNTTLADTCEVHNNILYRAVQGIAGFITSPGYINIDFSDIHTAVQGLTMIGIGSATGENKGQKATTEAFTSPLLDNINLANVKTILVNIINNNSLTVGELNNIGEVARKFTSECVTVIIGTVFEEALGDDELRITIYCSYGHPDNTNDSYNEAVNYRKPDNADALYDEAVNIVLESKRASISFVQRKLRIGYQRAARLIEEMEAAGIVSTPLHNGNREILVPTKSSNNYDD